MQKTLKQNNSFYVLEMLEKGLQSVIEKKIGSNEKAYDFSVD